MVIHQGYLSACVVAVYFLLFIGQFVFGLQDLFSLADSEHYPTVSPNFRL